MDAEFEKSYGDIGMEVPEATGELVDADVVLGSRGGAGGGCGGV